MLLHQLLLPPYQPHLGYLGQLGHRDFYPDGGSSQEGCVTGQDARPFGKCSHGRSYLYLLWSILEPTLFPSKVI